MRREDAGPLKIGGWIADRSTGRIERGGEVRALEPKTMDLLFLLASDPGRVFSKEELFAALWPDVTVGEDSLARCVSKLRKGLGEDAAIETIPKRGYRLLAPVADVAAAAEAPAPRSVRPGRQLGVGIVIGMAVVLVALLAWPRSAEDRQRAQIEEHKAISDADRAEAEARRKQDSAR